GRARRRRAAGDGAVVQRVGRRTDSLTRVAAHSRRHGLAHDFRAAGLRHRGAPLGRLHVERPVVCAATRPSVGGRGGGRDVRRPVLASAGALAMLGAGLMAFVPHDGPFATPALQFSWSAVPRILRQRAVTLANLGYLGHMWELYAMWTWIAAFVAASEHARTG